MARDLIDLYGVMQHMPEITGMELTWRNDSWEGMYYINGERHRSKKDKLRIKFWRTSDGCHIVLHEQGGESMSLQKWLVQYGGASDLKHARDIMRGKSRPNSVQISHTGRKSNDVKYVERYVYESLSRYEFERCPLYVYLCGIFGEEKVREVWHRYHVTTDGQGLAVFWYTDKEGRICYDKRMKYGIDGHRSKDFGGTRKYTTSGGYTARPLFGEHLIKEGEPIHVVESEKTALICSLAYPDKIFVSTGGKNNIHSLESGMILYPDMDAISYWKERIGSNICEWWLKYPDVGQKEDIGDCILREMQKKSQKVLQATK